MSKIVMTGCTGAIGTAIMKKAVENGDELIGIVHKGSKRKDNIPKSEQVHIVECNLEDYETFEPGISGDIFVHLAWDKTSGEKRDDVDIQLKNIKYTLDAVRLAHRMSCKVFVGAGSQAEYGIKNSELTSDMPVNPESGYGIAKYTAGKFGKMLCEQLNIRFNWVRILSVYGPGDGPQTLISYLIREMKQGNSPELTKCEQQWDYIHSEDAADAILEVANRGVNGKFYPLGSGEGRPLAEYVKDIRDIINPDIELKFGTKEYYPHQPMYLVADMRELQQDTGWRKKIEFKDGIKRML